jgi:hypothetical protein
MQSIEGFEAGQYHCTHCGASFTVQNDEQHLNAETLYGTFLERLQNEYDLTPKKKQPEPEPEPEPKKGGDKWSN